MKILITGASGFVGQHLALELKRYNHQLIGIGGLSSPQQIDTSLFNEYHSINLLEPTEIKGIKLSGIDQVVHLAGLASAGPSFSEPLKYINANMGMECNLFEAFLAQSLFPRFLIVSTGALYSNTAKLPINEQSEVKPSSPYAVSKLGQESLAKYYSSRGFTYLIARPFNHIGPRQGVGYILPDLYQQIIEAKKKNQKIIKVGNLATKRDYTDVRDVVRAYRLLLESSASNQVFNVCSGKSVSGSKLLELLLDRTNLKIEPVIDKTKFRPVDVNNVYGSYAKLNQLSGWKPEINIETTIKDFIEAS